VVAHDSPSQTHRLSMPCPLLLLLQVNTEPFAGGWIMKVKLSDPSELGSLLDSKAYEAHCEEGGH
jgi:hypothetical protein